MLMSHSQRAVFEYLQMEKGRASIGYSGRLREDAYGRITEEQLIKLCNKRCRNRRKRHCGEVLCMHQQKEGTQQVQEGHDPEGRA